MTKMDSKNLLQASQRVMELANKRRARLSAKAEAPKAEPVKAEAPKAEAPKAEPVKAEVEAAKPEAAPVVEAAKPEAAPAVEAKAEAPKAVEAAAPVKAEKMPENGGFEASLEKSGSPDLGEEDWGAHVPPELAKAVEKGTEEKEEMYPGILIPPGMEDMVMAVTDPSALESDAEVRFDLVPFLPQAAQTAQEVLNAGAHWVVLANGEPLAKINLKDQDHADKIVAHFVSADFARSIVDGIQKHGLKATFSAVKAKPYVAKVDEAAKIAEIKAKLEASSEEAMRQKLAGLKAKYVENLGLVLEAAANNFIVDNPLKDALIASLTSMGVPEAAASSMVDESFFQFGQKTLASFLDKAEEWSNTSPEAMREIKAAMQSAGRRSRPLPSTLGAAHTNPNYDQALANKMAASAVPVVPAESQTPVSASLRMGSPSPAGADRRSELRAKIGRFSTF